MSVEKITDTIYAIINGKTRGNVTALVLPTQLIFIDTGMNIPLVRYFKEKLESETGKKVSMLFITHKHSDHVFGNQLFSDCKIISSKLTLENIMESQEKDWTEKQLKEYKNRQEDPKALEELQIVIPNKTFDDEFRFIDNDVEIIVRQTGGHTNGSSYVYCPQYKVLIAGDNLFNERFPWGGDPTANPIIWLIALEEYLSLNVDFYIPGHGAVSGKEKIEEFHRYLAEVIELMERMITAGKSEEEIIEKANTISYYPPSSEEWKKATLKRWYDVLANPEG